ncbi:pentatricopeptide repeat-containing protein At3g02330, mitochondrial isoform X1 [Coffea eugenioides]|uniref:pentatricopeptide repeat-containing protein At3g02330, mitochondrial isoform X1 n=2 Tax=Coffea eugenioides TaxID=49369 RepID=UPI000F60F9B8|nr:pentatricopeptide repeat-containing protein At3g02330, mitochondrial isoform X1 [Coffea eugenioides]
MASLICRTRRFLVPTKPSFSSYLALYTLPISTVSAVAPANYWKTFSHIFQECSKERALDPGMQSHARMLTTGFKPSIFVSNCLIQMYVRCSYLDYANKVFDNMSQRDTVSWNTMIFAYCSTDIAMAQSFFGLMPERDVISWNTLISGYLQNGDYRKAAEIFVGMQRESVASDGTTFAVVLKACSGLEDYELGIQVHSVVVKVGFDHDVVTGSALVDMYGKCKTLDECFQFFGELPNKNWVSWSAAIAGCVQNDELVGGLKLFRRMQREGVGVSQSTYASVFRSCAALSEVQLGSQLHGHAIKNNFGYDVIVGTATLDMYAKCGNLYYAKQIFDLLPNRSMQSHNAIIVGYARGDCGYEALNVLKLLLKSNLGFNEISLSGPFSACAVIKGLKEGTQVHALATKSPFSSDVCVANAILDMYGKCGALVEARCTFDEMEVRDAVSWNAVIAAYEQNRNEEETVLLFVSMLKHGMEPDEFTFGSVLKACAGQQALNHGMEIHSLIIKSGMGLESFIGSALVDMYCKCGKVGEAEKLHGTMDEQTIVSWNAIISGFSSHEQSEEAQKFFSVMLEMGAKPDNFTYATVLDACANLATVELGKQIHAQIIKQELQTDVFITSTLVDMYSKCGNLQDCRLVFEKATNCDFVTWNAIVCGYAQHGLGEEALEIFKKMQLKDVKPNHATFVAVLRACAHIGLVEEGLHYFKSMQVDYGLDPQLDHYSCMVDILGRSNRVAEALKLIQEMPFEADDVIWRTLLSICKMKGNVEVAEKAAASLLQLDPQDSSTCVLLSNIYADAGMWEEVSRLRKVMRHGHFKKEPGCSWIEVKSEVHMFLVGDKAHPRCAEIYNSLTVLIDEMKWAGYVSDGDGMEDDYVACCHASTFSSL